MKPDRCSFCKGKLAEKKLVEGKTEFVAKVGEQIIAIKDVPPMYVKTVGKRRHRIELSPSRKHLDFFGVNAYNILLSHLKKY
jgi:hypothetical protein